MAVAFHDELVWDAGWHDKDVPSSGIDCLFADDERNLSALHDEDLLIGMAVKVWTVAVVDMAEEEGDRRAVLVTVK